MKYYKQLVLYPPCSQLDKCNLPAQGCGPLPAKRNFPLTLLHLDWYRREIIHPLNIILRKSRFLRFHLLVLSQSSAFFFPKCAKKVPPLFSYQLYCSSYNDLLVEEQRILQCLSKQHYRINIALDKKTRPSNIYS